jgi:Tol biopolymer transport system component
MPAESFETRTLSSLMASLAGVQWSPDGEKAAFTACEIVERRLDCEIWLAEGHGSEARKLTDAAGGSQGPAWWPDGERIAFSSDRT